MKRCSHCKEMKSESEFNKNRSRKDNLNHQCKICDREKATKWQRANPEKTKIGRLNYIKKNPEYYKIYRNSNKDKVNKTIQDWNQKNPDKKREYKHRYRARKVGNGGSFTVQEWHELCEKYGNKCLCCGEQKSLTADHVLPVFRGGTSNIDNIQPLCSSCNSRKWTREIDYR